ncbi:MAG: hypothetical protein AB4040_03280 [Synechococcus sp.]
MNLLKWAIARISHRCPSWQDLGYIAILVLSALAALAFFEQYRAVNEGDPAVQIPAVLTQLDVPGERSIEP